VEDCFARYGGRGFTWGVSIGETEDVRLKVSTYSASSHLLCYWLINRVG